MANSGFKTVKVNLGKTELVLYGGRKLVSAIDDIVKKTSLYEGVKLAQIMEAVYLQGKKDGARVAFESIDRSIVQVRKDIPHNRPGRPKRK
ncbi:MAG: hypothetical protein Q7U03_07820 [Syntrophales bacterium]|nr:hypothetical protein [Syntrophales bacterium]